MAHKEHDWQISHSPGESPPLKDDHLVLDKIPTVPAHHLEHATALDSRFLSNDTGMTRVSSRLSRSRTFMGLHPTVPILEEHDIAEHSHLWWPKIRLSLKEPIAEFFGVFIMLFFGNGSVAQVLLSTGQTAAPGGNGYGAYNAISWGWGIGVMLGVYVAGDSGAYLNPAITFTSCVLRKLPWRRLPIYLIAQFLGGFISAGVVYVYYIDSISKFEGGPNLRTVPPAVNATAGIFCTYPQSQVTKSSQFFSEFIESAVLMFVIFALKDDSNKGSFSASGNWFPLGLFFLIFGLGACFGYNTGYAMNLARDFGPRLMSYSLGYGHEVWSAGGYYFWIPMVAPFLGCLFGGILYDLFLYTGPSPINKPYFGLGAFVNPREAIQTRLREQRDAGIV